MKVTTLGIDLAKNVFQVHAVDERGTDVLRKQLRRDKMTGCFANVPPCVIRMDGCGPRACIRAASRPTSSAPAGVAGPPAKPRHASRRRPRS